jgi:hypothetical protein
MTHRSCLIWMPDNKPSWNPGLETENADLI